MNGSGPQRRIATVISIAAVMALACACYDSACGRPVDWVMASLLAVNGALSLAGLWYVVSRRSPWCAYWLPRLVCELGHWLFDLFWIYILALLSILIVPYLYVALLAIPPIPATILLVRRLRAERARVAQRLRLWT